MEISCFVTFKKKRWWECNLRTCQLQKYIGILGKIAEIADTSASPQSMIKQLGYQSGFSRVALSLTACRKRPMCSADSECCMHHATGKPIWCSSNVTKVKNGNCRYNHRVSSSRTHASHSRHINFDFAHASMYSDSSSRWASLWQLRLLNLHSTVSSMHRLNTSRQTTTLYLIVFLRILF